MFLGWFSIAGAPKLDSPSTHFPMPIARVDVSAFERCESLRQDAEIRAAADAQNAATSNHERYLSPQASATATGLVPRIPASRPDLKAKKRRELKVKAWDSYLASCLVAPSALQSPPAEDPRLVLKTLDVPVDLALPTLLANGSTSLAFSLSLTPIPDDDFFVADEIGVPAWATDFFHLLSSTTFQTVESKKPPRQSRSVSLRPILFNELSANAAWLPNTETFKTAKESGKEEDVYLVRAENCLEARSSQLRGRTFIWNENEMKNGRRRVPLIAVRVSGKVVPVTIETVSFQDDETNLETPTMVTISDTTDLIFLAPTYLHPFHRPRPSNETNSLLLEPQPPTDPSHPFHSAFSNALHNANLFAQLSLPPPRTILLRGPAGVGKRSILLHSLRKESVAVHLLKLGPILTRYEEAEEEDEDAGDHVSSIFKQAMMTVPSCVVVSDAEVLAEKGRATARAKLVSQLSGAVSRLKEGVVVVGLAENLDRNPVPELFTVDVPVSPPSSSQRQQIVESLLFKVDPDSAQFAAKLAGLTPGFLAGDLDALVRTAAWTCLGKVGRGKEASVKIGWDELAGALAISKGSQGVSSEPRRMEEGDWESFGGWVAFSSLRAKGIRKELTCASFLREQVQTTDPPPPTPYFYLPAQHRSLHSSRCPPTSRNPLTRTIWNRQNSARSFTRFTQGRQCPGLRSGDGV